MLRILGTPTGRAVMVLVAAISLVMVSHRMAFAQTSLTELQETQSASGEIQGDSLQNKGDKVPRQEARSKPPKKKAAVPQDPATQFADAVSAVGLNFVAIVKLLSIALLVLLWVKGGEWINQDVQIFKLGWYKWNLAIYFPFALAALVLFFLPVATFVRLPVLLIVFLATWVPYVLVHNKNVQPHQTVLTSAWWRFAFAIMASKLGLKVSAERKAEYEKGVDLELLAMGAEDANADNANLLSARNSPGYLLVKDAVAEMVNRRSEKAIFDFTKQAVNVRYEIDGVLHNGTATERESGDVMLAVMKTLANLNVKDRRSKQLGQFMAKYEGKSFLCSIATQGVSTGERAVLSRVVDKHCFESYSDLGMRDEIQEQWAELMAMDQGLVVLSTLPGGGLTAITDVSLEETDRLMRDFVSLEDVNRPENEIQNINVSTYDAAAGETPATILPRLIRTYPNVYVCRDLVDAESAKLLFDEIRDEHFVVTTIHAREAGEALLRILQKKIPAKDFAAVVKAVLYQRLVRLLCPECKVGYTPPADVFRKLRIPAGKVEHFYRPPKAEEIEKPCSHCQGIGYLGQVGVFELLVISDAMREILIKQPKLELLKKAAQASHQRLLQEEGILLVARGDTSLPELMRVLKQ
ncbi:MAG: Flp pilus assembly complex ATPase component TadA [Pirellulales bacterium]|nr:Flp pilus assembly complex ATPase component TadA [Pirellulales bacterium]